MYAIIIFVTKPCFANIDGIGKNTSHCVIGERTAILAYLTFGIKTAGTMAL